VFEPFFTTKDAGRGSGLGLSMVFGFVKQSNGHITIQSREGEGTTITIYLPRSLKQVKAVHVKQKAETALGGDETILVVEDNPDVRSYVAELLDSMGYQVHEAEDGKSALLLLEGGLKPDLLFSDVVLPGGLNGIMVADEACKRCPGLKVMFTSGYSATVMNRQGGLDDNAVLLNKPYTSRELGQKLRLVLDEPVNAA